MNEGTFIAELSGRLKAYKDFIADEAWKELRPEYYASIEAKAEELEQIIEIAKKH
jgi:hypothetical protein